MDITRSKEFKSAFWLWFDSLSKEEKKRFWEYPADMAMIYFYNRVYNPYKYPH